MSQSPEGDHQANGRGGNGRALPSDGEPSPSAEILVVEDDPEINALVGAYAQLAGFTYRSAMCGEAALEEVHRRAPSLIVLDLMLPDMSGLEVCRRVKSNASTSQVPVVILTALDHEGTRRQGMVCGAAEYLTKPFDPDTLMQAISRCASVPG